jgi:hypothetical protein
MMSIYILCKLAQDQKEHTTALQSPLGYVLPMTQSLSQVNVRKTMLRLLCTWVGRDLEHVTYEESDRNTISCHHILY